MIVYNDNIGGIAPVCYSPPIVEMRVLEKGERHLHNSYTKDRNVLIGLILPMPASP